MAHQSSEVPEGPQSQPYHLVSAIPDSSLTQDKKGFTSTTTEIFHPTQSKYHSQVWSAAQVLFTATIPLIALITWLACTRGDPRMFDTFAGEKIGGHLSQAQAKAIDVVAGAIMVPLFMAAVNYIWFDSARVSAVNEQNPQAIPLRTLIATSCTSSGNFDPFALRDLLLGKSSRLYLFALLTLLSAVSRSALSNIIAYEAFSEIGSTATSVDLRLQNDVVVARDSGYANELKLQMYDFDMAQNANVAKDMMALLTDLSYQGAASKLTNGTYVGFNATSQSLESLPQSVVELQQVPAYRLSVECTPDLPNVVSVMQPTGFFNTQIGLMLNTSATSNNTIFQANYPGVPDNLRKGEGNTFVYAAFSMGYREVYLGYMERFNLTNNTDQSAYGNVGYRAFNMSQWGFTGTQIIMSFSGLRCVLYRENGHVNAVRKSTNVTSAGSWNIVSTDFPAQEKVIIPSQLSKFQGTNLNFHAPGASTPGLGPALARKTVEQVGNWGTLANDTYTNFALNFLYASGETQRIIYEVAASSGNATRRLPEYFVKVPALETQQHYRITYVPSILLLGLLSLFGASAVTGAMAMYARNSASARAHRQVNVTRVLLDSIVGLESDRDELSNVAQRSNGEVDEWAAGYKVKYTAADGGSGSVQIILDKRDI